LLVSLRVGVKIIEIVYHICRQIAIAFNLMMIAHMALSRPAIVCLSFRIPQILNESLDKCAQPGYTGSTPGCLREGDRPWRGEASVQA